MGLEGSYFTNIRSTSRFWIASLSIFFYPSRTCLSCTWAWGKSKQKTNNKIQNKFKQHARTEEGVGRKRKACCRPRDFTLAICPMRHSISQLLIKQDGKVIKWTLHVIYMLVHKSIFQSLVGTSYGFLRKSLWKMFSSNGQEPFQRVGQGVSVWTMLQN